MAAPSTLQSASLSAIATNAPIHQGYHGLRTDRREIRLLDIGPNLACSLRHANLDDKPRYFALSYYWGALGEELPITIDGEQVKLRKTLHRFFEVLQKHFNDLTVWVDVICINQRDRVEQSHQVSMMGDIYRGALCVYAWLGDGDADSDFALSHIDQWLVSHCNTEAERAVSRYVEQICLRPYFTRSWIVQECSLNNSTSIVCGDYILEWDLLRLALHYIPQRNNESPIVPLGQAEQDHDSPGSTRFMRIQQAREDVSSGKRTSIFRQVCDFAYTQCADPIDKIYAFRALCTDSHKVQVDYTQPTLGCISQVLSVSYQDRAERRSHLVEQAIQLLRCTNLSESQLLLGLCPSPADVLIESFTPSSMLGDQHKSYLGPIVSYARLKKRLRLSYGDLLYPPGTGVRFVTPGGDNTWYKARAYLVIDIDLKSDQILRAYCLQMNLLPNIGQVMQAITEYTEIHPWESKRLETKTNLISSSLSSLRRIHPVSDIFKGRVKLCRKARKVRKIPDTAAWRSYLPSSKVADREETCELGVHMSRVALMAFLNCSVSEKPCPESFINYSRDHPPAPDEAECTCTEDLLFDPDLDSQSRDD